MRKIGYFILIASVTLMVPSVSHAGAIGNPNVSNHWDTTSAVGVTTSGGSGYTGREWIYTINGMGLDLPTGTLHNIYNWNGMGIGPGTANPRGGTINDGVYGDRWIQYSFDQIYALDHLDIWAYNEQAEIVSEIAQWYWRAMSVKDVYIQVSKTGGSNPSEWTTVAETTFNCEPCDLVPVTTTVNFGGIEARYVVITLKNGVEGTYISNLGMTNTDFGLSEVRFFGTPTAMPAIGNPTAANAWSTTSAVSVRASQEGYPAREWINTINGSGLDAATGMLHAAGSPYSTMAIASGAENPRGGTIYTPNDPNGFGKRWIEYSFDQIYVLDAMDVWAYNENANWYWSALSVKDVYIQVSTTGSGNAADWTPVGAISWWANPADPTPAVTQVDFGGKFGTVLAKYVVVSLKNNNEGTYINNLGRSDSDFGLSEVRFYGLTLPGVNACGDLGTVYLDSDINRDCYVDLRDFLLLTNHWTQCTDPQNRDCDTFWSWQ